MALVKKLFERFGTSPWLYWSHAVPWRLAQLLRGVVRLKGGIFRNDPFIELVRSLDAEVQRRRAQRTVKIKNIYILTMFFVD